MRVEQDDVTSDWTRPGVFEVAPGVYRIPLPLPHDGLRSVNVYALAVDDGLVLVDSGWAITEARQALDAALAALGACLGDVRRFLVTHIHRDHYAMAVAVRREFGTAVSLGEGEEPAVQALSTPGNQPMSGHWQTLIRCGAGEIVEALRARAELAPHDPADWAAPDDWLAGATDVVLPTRTLRVVATPGHTRGHVVFIDRDAQLMFAGDHVLPHITPSIGFEAVPAALPLGNYLDSLRLVRSLPDQRLLPAHGPVGPSVHTRVDELLHHHAERLDHACTVVQDGATAYEAARRLTWTRRQRSFTDLDLFNQMLAVTETAAHLDVLVVQGRLKATDADGVRRYDPA
ncbi:MBL fold metallo-hydrolase [Dactylosporangium sp. AC04546]|uniref:MBL fold metallo-hydrolase n=1 Tax=Dactylosporangium sp. AC04546 TaxID=2862460 RepID=UPI001EE06F86|nr:MBL fold metallo-hydrolase [Dactylosporangium sp. AC04546]WVK86867.1 MBL fold metallo-hydrolase [Dactylosporangium sp. AC04546]